MLSPTIKVMSESLKVEGGNRLVVLKDEDGLSEEPAAETEVILQRILSIFNRNKIY